MTKKEKVTKEAILEAARNVFIEKGFDGARMQEIATRAGINKALLHYYYTSKDFLFDEVFKEAFSKFAPRFKDELSSVESIKGFLKLFVEIYVQLLVDHPYLPIFVLSELHRNPDRLEKLVREMGVKPEMIKGMIGAEMEKGNIVKMDPRELVANILGLCIFPFAARPMLERMLWNNNKDEYQTFLINRSKTIYQFVERAIFIK